MSITSRINEMSSHIEQAYDELQGLGADLTNVNKNIENISAMLEDAYKEAPKISDTDTDITLDNTRKGRVDMEFSGNTSQETTTGKNLLSIPNMTNTHNGITFDLVDNNIMSFSGTATGSWANLNASNLVDNPMISGQTYTFSIDAAQNVRVVLYETSPQTAHVISEGNKSVTFQASGADNIFIGITNLTTNTNYNGIVKMQLELGNTATDWEEYSGGIASPNPDYPQDIRVVSGDNSIEICGKNMFDDSIVTNLWSEYSTNKIVSANGANLHKFNCKQGDTFTLKATYDSASSNSVILIQFFDSNDNSLGRYASANDTTLTLTKTAPANTSYAYMGRYLNTPTTIQLEKNNQATNYEPYKEGTYPINLGVKNLWDVNNLQSGFLPQSGSYPTTNTSYPNARYTLITLKKDKSITLSGITFAGSGRVRYIDIDTNEVVGNMTYLDSAYYTATHTFGDGFYEGTITAKKDFIVGIMDLNGEINNLIVNYGTTPQTISPNPIELAEISTYNDEIFRTSGKNIIDLTSLITGTSSTSSTNIEKNSFTQSGMGSWGNTYFFLKNNKNTDYTISMKALSSLARTTGVSVYGGETTESTTGYTNIGTQWLDITANTPGSTSYSFNSGNYEYILFRFWNNGTASALSSNVDLYISEVQLELGSTATEYNPFGTGEWYYKEATKKLVLDGTQNITLASGTPRRFNATYTTLGITNIKEGSSAEDTTLNYRKCDHFIYSAGLTSWGRYYLYNSWLVLLDNNSVMANAEALKTWLSNNKTTIRYPLATPTYTKITSTNYPTLYSQLEAIYNAQGYDNQTNISQTNNDLPFKITASALEG